VAPAARPFPTSHSAHNPKDALANIKASNADRDWDNAISSCGPIVPPCPPANDAFPVRRARIVAARLDTYRPSSPTASTWFRASQSIPCWSRGPDPTSVPPTPRRVIGASLFPRALAMNLMLINVSTRKFRRAVRLPEGDVPAPTGAIVDRLDKVGINPVTSTPAEFDAFFRSEAQRWAKAFHDSGIRLD
jgi:hypothetical protein